MNDQSVALSAIGVVITAVGALVWIVKFLMVEMRKSIDHNTSSYQDVARVLGKLSISTDKNTRATMSADAYLRKRNGRDNEHHKLVLEGLEAIPTTMKKIADDQANAIIRAVVKERKVIKDQRVVRQTVEHEVVKNKEEK